MILNRLNKAARNALVELLPGLAQRWRHHRDRRRRQTIQEILANPAAPSSARGEHDFALLQERYPGIPVGDYYDPRTCWKRAAQRAIKLGDLVPGNLRTAEVLEVGCGDGLTGHLLASSGHHVILSDMDDWRDERSRSLPFVKAVLEEGLPFPDASFDFIFSYESFEHFKDPAKCFAELTRLCRPGGTAYFEFGPIYASAWGLHAYTTLKMPYAQYLLSEAFISRQIGELGISDLNREMFTLQPLNKWRIDDFMRLFCSPGWRIDNVTTGGPAEFLPLVRQYPEAFRGRNLSFEDIVTQWIMIALRRESVSADAPAV